MVEGPSPAALLLGLSREVVAAFLGPAIDAAEPGELPALAAAAVPAGPGPVAACIARLGGPGLEPGEEAAVALESALAAAPDLTPAMGLAAGRGLDPAAIPPVVALLETRPEAGAGGLIAGLAGEPGPEGEAAAAALRRWAEAGGDRRAGVDEARLAATAWRATRRTDLLLALALLAARGVPVADPEDDPALAIALGSLLQRSGRAGTRLGEPRLLRWLAVPLLRRTAQRALGDARSPDAHAAVVSAGHLADLPAVRAGLAGVSRPGRAVPREAAVAALGPRAARGLARLLRRLPTSAPLRRRALASLVRHEDGAAAWRAAGALAVEPVGRVGEALARAAVRPDGGAARPAVRRLREAGGGDALELMLAQRGSGAVARAARRRRPTDERSGAGRTAAWRRAVRLAELTADRGAVIDRWRAELVSGDAAVRRAAVLAIDRTGVVRGLVEAVIAATRDPDPAVAAAACDALRWARDEASAAALVVATDRADAAVRAAALASLRRRGRVPAAALVAAARSDDAGERATAVAGLAAVDRRRAIRLAAVMLVDARPAHRIGGADAARRLGDPRLARVLREVARRDRDAVVRRRARAALAVGGGGDEVGPGGGGGDDDGRGDRGGSGGRGRAGDGRRPAAGPVTGAAAGRGAAGGPAAAAVGATTTTTMTAAAVGATPVPAATPAPAVPPAPARAARVAARLGAAAPLLPAGLDGADGLGGLGRVGDPAGPPTVVGGLEPSTAGLVVAGAMLALAAIGAARVVRRHLDPAERAERVVMDRAGVEPGERRLLRRAARRLEPPVPASSLLLSRRLLEDAAAAERTPAAEADRLRALVRRRFGARTVPRADGDDAGPGAASSTIDVRRGDPVLPATGRGPAAAAVPAAGGRDPQRDGRTRAAALLAVALESAEARRRQGGWPARSPDDGPDVAAALPDARDGSRSG